VIGHGKHPVRNLASDISAQFNRTTWSIWHPHLWGHLVFWKYLTIYNIGNFLMHYYFSTVYQQVKFLKKKRGGGGDLLD
jgi:hypothetical protein